MRLVPLGVAGRDYDIEEALDRQDGEGEVDRAPALRRHDAELAALRRQLSKRPSTPGKACKSA